MNKVAIIGVGNNGRSSRSIYIDLINFLKKVFELVAIDADVLEDISKIDKHTHIVFITDDMCELANEVKRENPEKDIIILSTGGVSERKCLKNIISIQKGKSNLVKELLLAIA